MIKILIVIPYRELLAEFSAKIAQKSTAEIHIDIMHIYGTHPKALIENCPYDIIIARGITYQSLQRLLPKVHMIEIRMGGFDVVAAVQAAKARYNAQRIAVLVHKSTLHAMDKIAALSGISIHTYEIENETDIVNAINDAQKHAIDVFIGGLTVNKLSQEKGFQSIQIKTGSSTIEQEIDNAISAAKALQLERTKTELMQTILNNAKDAVIAVDEKVTITAFNNKVYRDLKIPTSKALYAKKLADFYAYTYDVKQCIATASEQDAIRLFAKNPFLVNNKPILVDGQCVGALVTLQSTEKITEAESRVRKELNAHGLLAKYTFADIVGSSEVMRDCVSAAIKYSRVNSNVLITGETGTGKELFAQSIHNASPRNNQPFVAVNCAALPENLLESELFGYADSAFSGAARGGKTGLFELAHRGTIFLDEIGELPLALQAKLLRVLQEHEIRQIGGVNVIRQKIIRKYSGKQNLLFTLECELIRRKLPMLPVRVFAN